MTITQLRDPSEGGSRSIAFGPFVLDHTSGRLWHTRTPIELRPKTWQVLSYLTQRPGVLVPTDELMTAAWSGTAVTPQTLTNVIGELRAALGDNARKPRWIETVHGRGYRFVGEIEPVESGHTLHAGHDRDDGSSRPPHDAHDVRAAQEIQSEIFVGRDVELEKLASAWRHASAGDRQIVFLSGDAGIGKTALADAFIRRLEATTAPASLLVARGNCVEQHGEREPYLPVLAALEELAGGPRGDDVRGALLRYAPTWLLQIPWLADEATARRIEASLGGTTAVRMLREGASVLEALSRASAVVIVLEDLHWADTATIDFLAALAHRRGPARLMLIGTYRPDDAARDASPVATSARNLTWRGAAGDIPLAPFDRTTIEAYLAARLDDRAAAAALAARIEEHSAGSPLFIRALTQQILEGGRLAEVTADPSAAALELPDALKGWVDAQLAMLSPLARHAVEAGSVAGMEFAASEIAGALRRPSDELDAAFRELARAGRLLAYRDEAAAPARGSSSRYRFIHVLYRTIVYDGIPASDRIELHRSIASGLEKAYGEGAHEVAARIAAHYEQAGDGAKTCDYLQLAALNAARRLAYREAADYLRSALALCADLPLDHELERRRALLYSRLGDLVVLTDGYSSDSVGAAFSTSRTLYDAAGDTRGCFTAEMGLTIHELSRANYRGVREHTDYMLARATSKLPGMLPVACCYAAYADSAEGKLEQARALLEDGAGREAEPGSPDWFDIHRMIDAQLALVLVEMGEVRRAVMLRDQSLAKARRDGTQADLAAAALWAAEAAVLARDRYAGMAAADLAIAVGEENGLPSYLTSARIYRAWLDPALDAHERVAEMERALALRRDIGDRWQHSVHLTLLADANRAAGDLGRAFACLDRAEAFVAETGERHYEAEILRTRGECLATEAAKGAGHERSARTRRSARKVHERAEDAEADAERCFRQAIEVAHRSGARLFELRAGVSLARSLDGSSRADEGHAMLAEIYDRFGADDLDATDLREAREQLEAPVSRAGR